MGRSNGVGQSARCRGTRAWPEFGELACSLAGVSPAQVEECAHEQRRGNGRLASILRRRGLLSRVQFAAILREQARCAAAAARADAGHAGGGNGPPGFPYPAFLSVCLPAYNEEANVGDTVEAACAILPEVVQRFEVVVVDDGSHDDTSGAVRRAARGDPRVRIVRHEHNRGYGAAVATGLQAAAGDLLFFMDADGQFSLLDLPRLLVPLARHDVVVGYRHDRADSLRRRLMAWGWNRLVRWVLGVAVRDLDCAFKVLPRRVVDRLRLTATSPALNAEILLQCARGGLTLAEVPVHHFPRYHGVAAGCGWRMIVRAFRDLARLWKCRMDPNVALKDEACGGAVAAPARLTPRLARPVADDALAPAE